MKNLETNQVSLRYGESTVLNNISLSLEPGQMTALLGCNGAGKSSLLKIMAGDLKATSGSVSLDGKALDQYSASALAKRRAVLTQKSTLSFAFKVHQVVSMGAANSGLRRADKERLVILLLRLTGTQHLVQRDYTSLSGGEQQRVHFARTLVQLWHSTTALSPILLLDEPVAALDLAWQQRVLEIAQWLAKSRQWTVLAVLHDMNQAAAYADQVYLLEDGHCLKSGSPRETLNSVNLKQAFGVLAHVQDHPLVPERPQVIPIKADLPAIEDFF